MLCAALSFYDTSPTGRILNRFSKDQASIDTTVTGSLSHFLEKALQLVAALVVSLSLFPRLAVVLLVLTFPVATTSIVFRWACCDIRCHCSVSMSPLLSHYSETVRGDGTIRAFGAQDRFCATNLSHFFFK